MKSQKIDILDEEIFLIDDVVPENVVQNWMFNIVNHGSFVQGFLAYGGNPPSVVMDRTGDPKFIEKIRSEGSFSPYITGTYEKSTWYMNVSRSPDDFENAAKRAYVEGDYKDGNYVNKEGEHMKLDPNLFYHHPKVHETVDQAWDVFHPQFEETLGVKLKPYNNCYVHAFQHGDSTWAHQDYMDYSAVVYLNPPSLWDLRKWGGETLFFNDDVDFVRATTAPKGGSAVVFRGDIFHKVASVSWESQTPRYAATYFFDKDD